jgi:hypothetical protein
MSMETLSSVLTLPRPKLKIRLDLKGTVLKTEEAKDDSNVSLKYDMIIKF